MRGPSKISFVIPVHRRALLFAFTLSCNECFASPDAEVVLALDGPEEEVPILGLVRRFPEIRFRVIVNDQSHEWRNPAPAFNVGIRNAIGDHVALLSPETILALPYRDYLLRLLSLDYRAVWFGLLWDTSAQGSMQSGDIWLHLMHVAAIKPPIGFGYGFIMCQRWALEEMNGFDESLVGYGVEDFDLRQRLLRFGSRLITDPGIRIFHLRESTDYRDFSGLKPNTHVVLKQPNWGRDFCRVAYDWRFT